MRDVTELVDRYVGVWNEPDGEARRRTIASLWTKEGATLAKAAENCARGYEAIEARVTSAYQKWVRDAGFVFRSRHNDGACGGRQTGSDRSQRLHPRRRWPDPCRLHVQRSEPGAELKRSGA